MSKKPVRKSAAREAVTPQYVLIDPRSYRVDVFRRNVHNRWELFAFTTIESQVEFASLNFRVAMQAIYEDVDFELVGQKD